MRAKPSATRLLLFLRENKARIQKGQMRHWNMWNPAKSEKDQTEMFRQVLRYQKLLRYQLPEKWFRVVFLKLWYVFHCWHQGFFQWCSRSFAILFLLYFINMQFNASRYIQFKQNLVQIRSQFSPFSQWFSLAQVCPKCGPQNNF